MNARGVWRAERVRELERRLMQSLEHCAQCVNIIALRLVLIKLFYITV